MCLPAVATGQEWACCCIGSDDTCANLTEEDCNGAEGAWFADQLCSQGGFSCPLCACAYYEGENENGCGSDCTLAHSGICDGGTRDGEPCDDGSGSLECPDGTCRGVRGCDDLECCTDVCAGDPFCCRTHWDESCVTQAFLRCDLPPVDDECHCATEWAVGACSKVDLFRATENPTDPTFCCHNDAPWESGFGTRWMKFVAPMPNDPNDEFSSVRIDACCSISRTGAPQDDSMLQVFRVMDHGLGICDDGAPCNMGGRDCADGSICAADDARHCANLVRLGCNDDSENGCYCSPHPHDSNARLCVDGLVPGETYYVMLAAKTPLAKRIYEFCISTPCEPDTPICPSGPVTWLDPSSGVVDARQPHPPSDETDLQGVYEIVVDPPLNGDSPCCWTLCDTDGQPLRHPSYAPLLSRNEIAHIEGNDDDTLTITLKRPITPGEVTTITYGGDPENPGTFASHPGNVDADAAAGPPDILKVIDYLNRVAVSPWGIYGEDIDHSDQLEPPDILRVIDLLNGAGAYPSWLHTSLPTCSGCCP